MNFFFNEDQLLLGEDKRRCQSWNRNYYSQCVIFEKPVPNMHDRIETVMTELLDAPNSLLRVRPTKDYQYFRYDKRKTRNILKHMIKHVPEIVFEEIEEYTSKNQYTFVLFYTEMAFCLCCQHAIFDGVSSYNLIQRLFDKDHSYEIQPFQYIPVLTEAVLIPDLIACSTPSHKYLQYNVPDDVYITHRVQHNLCDYKRIKNASPEKVAFNSVVISEIVQHLFKIVKTNKLTICVLVGMNSMCRFNNYGVITATLARPKKTDSRMKYLSYVHNTIAERKAMAAITFVGMNVHELSPATGGSIDIMFSGMPMTMDTPITMNDVSLQRVESNIRYTTGIPLYCGFLSCDTYINFYFNINTHDVDKDALAEVMASSTNN